MSESLQFKCQPSNTQKAVSSLYSELLISDDKLNRRPAYQRNLAWSEDQKSKYIDTIMSNCPSPVLLLYMCPEDVENECIDGQNRMNTIKEYIEQDSSDPFPWMIVKEDSIEYVYYNNLRTMEGFLEFYSKKNAKKSKKKITYRGMTDMEMKRFNNYEVVISTIREKLTFEQRQEIFMRWQNGTPIAQCDAFKNEHYEFCKFVVEKSLDTTLAKRIGDLLKSGTNNWLWDIYRIMHVIYESNEDNAILASIQARTNIVKNAIPKEKYDELHKHTEKFLKKLEPLSAFKKNMHISFILGYIYLYKISPENVRNIIEKKEFLLDFAEKSLQNNEIEHSTLNNGPKLNEFKESFPVFRAQFHELVSSYYPQPDDKILQTPKKKQSIPAELKRQVWNTYNGVEKGQAKCFTCGVNDVSQGTFEAGHVIPEFIGGTTSLENLRPICSGCNKSMATKHMATYMKNHYPLRIQQINSLTQ